ncbi:MAG: SLC13 family permease [Acidiferrobacterales bacterium]
MTIVATPDAHAIAVFALIVVALYLFTREHLPLETSALLVLVLLAAGFEIFPYERDGETLRAIDFFSGFGHEALIAVSALMIAGQGLVRTGALEPIGRFLARTWVISPMLSLLLTMLAAASLSAFMNNVPIVVLLLPILISVSLRTGKPASGMLMPMGFATLLGGTATTIGTSTNLLVVSIAADLGMHRFSMFEFFVPAVISGGLAIVYLWLVAPRLLPARTTHLADTSPRVFASLLHIPQGSFAEGRSLAEIIDKTGGAMKIERVLRGRETAILPLPDAIIKVGDRLSIEDTPEQLKEFEEVLGANLYSGEKPVTEENPLSAADQQLAEIIVTQGSPLDGVTLNRAYFSDRYHLMTLAIHRVGWVARTWSQKLGDIRLRIGDVLLVQGDRERISSIKRSGTLLVLDATADLPRSNKAWLALTIMAAIVLVAAAGILPISISAVCGVTAMILTGCLNWRDAATALSKPVIMIVVASLAMGMALLKTGGAEYLAHLFVSLTSGMSPTLMIGSLMLVMVVVTNVVTNNAAAVIGTPIAISIASQVNLPAEPFVLAVLFGANMSYATPMAYNTNLLVMNAGGYKFSDFMRVGIPMILIVWLSLCWLLPMRYGL